MIQREREFCRRMLFAPLFFLKNIYLCDYDEKTYCINSSLKISPA